MAKQILLIRHGQTEWSRTGRHTGTTDVELTDEGRRKAQQIGLVLQGRKFASWTSPLIRAAETCRLAGFGDGARIEEDLREWDYGEYEGLTTLEIRKQTPDWSVWLAPVSGGESLEQVAERARRVIDRAVSYSDGDVGLFAHGHILRILAACWIGAAPYLGRSLALDTASVSTLGYERETRVIRNWNVPPPE